MSQAAKFEIVGFSSQSFIFPLSNEPLALPDEPLPPLSSPRKHFQEKVPQETIDIVVEPLKDTLNDSHLAALSLAVQYHKGRLDFKRAFSIAAMGAEDFEGFSLYFERLTARGVHLPFKSPKRQIVRKVLKEAYPSAFSVLGMEQGAVAVGAYFNYFNPRYIDETVSYLAHRLRRSAAKYDNKPAIVDPGLADTKEFIEVALDRDNNSRPQHIIFAKTLHKRLVLEDRAS